MIGINKVIYTCETLVCEQLFKQNKNISNMLTFSFFKKNGMTV